MYLYLLRCKDKALDAFKVFKVEVDNQCGKHINIVILDRGREYYNKYMENGQTSGPFAKFLQENGIVAQYTMLSSSDHNGVAERRNQTLMDMVRSLRSNTKLPQYFWTKALKTTMYILIEFQPRLSLRRLLSYSRDKFATYMRLGMPV